MLQALGTIRIWFLQKKSKKKFHACVPLRNPDRNLKSENCQDYAQKPQRNCTFWAPTTLFLVFEWYFWVTEGTSNDLRCMFFYYIKAFLELLQYFTNYQPIYIDSIYSTSESSGGSFTQTLLSANPSQQSSRTGPPVFKCWNHITSSCIASMRAVLGPTNTFSSSCLF